MDNQMISSRQLACVTGLFIIGGLSLSNVGSDSGRDAWFGMLVATLAASLLAILYGRISSLYSTRDIFEIIRSVFGRWLGWLIILAVTLYSFRIGILSLRGFPEFVQATSMPNTPRIIFIMLIGLVCAYMARQGVSAFGKISALFAVITVLVVIATSMMLIPNMDIENLRPALATRPEVLGKSALAILAAPLGESVLMLCFFCQLKPGSNRQKTYLFGVLFGAGILLISILRNIMTLGAGNMASLFFPSYSAVSIINIGDFFHRVEVMAASYLLLCDIVKVAVAIYVTSLGISKLFLVDDYKKIVFPLTWLMIGASALGFDSAMELFGWQMEYVYFALPLQIILPFIVWIWGEGHKAKLA